MGRLEQKGQGIVGLKQGGPTYDPVPPVTPYGPSRGKLTPERWTEFQKGRGQFDHSFHRFRNGGQISGPGDGQSDSIPALIDGQKPAALSSGEYVIDAHTVAMIGAGSTEAGIKRLDRFVANVRKQAIGKTSQPKPVGIGRLK